LLSAVEQLAAQCAQAGAAPAARARVQRHILSSLCCLGRHTLTGHLATAGRQFADWSADYRMFSQQRVDPSAMFAQLQRTIAQALPAQEPVVTALDDTRLKKCSKRTPGVAYNRDPLGPAFHTNLILAQRFIQQSMAFYDGSGAGRMVPVDWTHAPVAAKPRRKASAAEWAAYREARREQTLGRVAAGRLALLRSSLDQQDEAKKRQLVCTVDGGYTNKTFLGELPERCSAIGRIRGDAKLYHLPEAQCARGRRRIYGAPAPTPEKLRQDESVPWEVISLSLGGETRQVRVKTLAPLRWRATGATHQLRLVVIAPQDYRVSQHSRVLYRRPADLICTDPALSVQQIVQYYFWRWDIEQNFRDEKTLLGIGQAQVHNAHSVELAPALGVVAYSILLCATLKLYGVKGAAFKLPPPKWQAKPPARATTQQLITQLRHDMWGCCINSSGFATPAGQHTKSDKFIPTAAAALIYGAARA
jgi:hypothetical protein